MRLTRITALTAVATLAAAVAMASPAHASNGVVGPGEFGLYYSPGSTGWVVEFTRPASWDQNDKDLRNNYFYGTTVIADNNTASYRNYDDRYVWYVYTGYSQTGTRGCLPAGWVGNASSTFRNTISSVGYDATLSCS